MRSKKQTAEKYIARDAKTGRYVTREEVSRELASIRRELDMTWESLTKASERVKYRRRA